MAVVGGDLQDALTGSWLAVRLGIEPVKLDILRRSGELYAYRPPGSDDWLYPPWQFDEDGHVRPAVERVLAAARERGLGPVQLHELFNRRTGLAGGRRMYELLAEGEDDAVLGAIRSATA
jgi:hypothetical protein